MCRLHWGMSIELPVVLELYRVHGVSIWLLLGRRRSLYVAGRYFLIVRMTLSCLSYPDPICVCVVGRDAKVLTSMYPMYL
jgi:hypothetical protein